ncbi:MAG TPA: hypothetical protein VK461_05210 [Acidimicrobiales bacterium]|nr:hypothetical protein [Acidimicrobiales bacterium]
MVNAEMLMWCVIGLLGLWMLGVGFAAWRSDHRRRAERRNVKPPAPTNWGAVTSRPER